MVHKCAAYGCKSGYKSTENTADHQQEVQHKVTFHKFPIGNEELCDKWIRANPRKDFVPTKHSTLCSLHFQPSDFVDERRDTNNSRRKRKSAVSEKPLRRHFKDGAVPSIFPNAPPYLSTPTSVPRTSSKAPAGSRREQEARRLDMLEASFQASDDISDVTADELVEKLRAETTVPSGFTYTVVDQKLFVFLLTTANDVPKVSACITVKSDLTVVVSLEEKVVSASQYQDLLKGSLKSMSQLVNLMARVKSWMDDRSSRPLNLIIQMATDVLAIGLEMLDENDDKHRKISFIIEQLKLVLKREFGRHYSPGLMIMAFMIHAASQAAYKVLLDENILCLPSISTLKKLTRRLNKSGALDNSQYLKMRVKKLNQFQRTVLLIIDEIYVAKRVEYSGGEIKGLSADGSVASTLLCFMVKSLVDKYKDIVAIYPMHQLTANKQLECYLEVMDLLHSVSLNVVAISVDNATTNRKFFVHSLCDGQLRTSVINQKTGQPIFLVFDPVHDLKNVYNNFQARKVFECPSMDQNLPDGCRADFKDIVDLHSLEAPMALRKAHKLSPAVLDPKSIEKTSVKLAVSVFCESTRDALNFYAANEGKSAWRGTADLISLILKLWNVMNVKTTTKGKRKRDYTMDPVRSSLDWKLQFLREFADFLQRWETTKKPGLSRETFLALRHTCLALADCSSYLMDRLGFNVVLLGHLQSDAIESRFGWLRQLSGANYYISMRQVIESDTKIRVLSLVKFSGFSLAEIEEAAQSSEVAGATVSSDDNKADSMATALTTLPWPSSNDSNIIFYVS
jgi:hypothetical protein